MIHHWKGLHKFYPTETSGILYNLTGSRNSRWWTPDRNFHLNTYISACRQHRNEISKAKSMFSRSTYPMELQEMLYDITGSKKSKMAASKTGNTYISACRLDSNAIPKTTQTFSRSSNSMGLLQSLPDTTGSQKSKMAAAKPEILISHLVDWIATRFQRLPPHFRCPATKWDSCKVCPT